jgi:hypothetical protein
MNIEKNKVLENNPCDGGREKFLTACGDREFITLAECLTAVGLGETVWYMVVTNHESVLEFIATATNQTVEELQEQVNVTMQTGIPVHKVLVPYRIAYYLMNHETLLRQSRINQNIPGPLINFYDTEKVTEWVSSL